MQISADGMSETKSTSISVDVYSSRFNGCKMVYPYRLVRPIVKNFPINHKEQFDFFIQDLLSNNAIIKQYIADNLKRAVGKDCKNHAATFPCEYCFARGVRITVRTNCKKTQQHLQKICEKIQNNTSDNYEEIEKELEKAEKEISSKMRSRIVWPSSTRNGEPRTHRKILEIVEKIEENGPLPADEAKGIVGRSPLFSIPNFDIVIDSPTEYLHSVCLGGVKRLIELTFSVGENRVRVSKIKLCDPAAFKSGMQHMKVVRESSRRIRELDFAVMKGQEFRNIILFYTPVVIDCLEKTAKERKVWLLFTYMIRSCILPVKEFRNIDLDELNEICSQFYVLYEKLYGEHNCTYNTNIVSSHLPEMRHHGPLTFTSAFGFESFYGEVRNAFVPGTKSTLKQIFRNILLKRNLSPHCCENTIYYSNKETALEDNTLIYTYEHSKHQIYKIKTVKEDSLICFKQGRYEFNFQEIPNVNVANIGIYKRGAISLNEQEILKKNICGKVLKVKDMLITCPNNILREK